MRLVYVVPCLAGFCLFASKHLVRIRPCLQHFCSSERSKSKWSFHRRALAGRVALGVCILRWLFTYENKPSMILRVRKVVDVGKFLSF